MGIARAQLKPLAGQRVQDILAIVEASLRAYPATKSRPIYIAALGKLTTPALFAAALESGIHGLYRVQRAGLFWQSRRKLRIPRLSVRELRSPTC